MRKTIIIFLLFIVFSSGSFSTSTVFGSNNIRLDNLEEYYVNELDFTYSDLDLTDAELAAVERYQSETLDIGLYEIDGYYQEYEGIEIGRHYHTVKQLEKVFEIDVNIVTSDFQSIMTMYYDDQLDIVPGLIKTGDREDFFYFSDYSVLADLYLFDNEYIDINDVYDLDNIVIAKQSGMEIISPEYIDYLDERGISISLIEYENIVDAIDDLGISVDYIIHSRNIDLIKLGLNFKNAENLINSYDLKLTSQRESDLVLLLSAVEKAYEYGLKVNIEEYGRELTYLMFQEQLYFTDEEIAFINTTIDNPIQVTSSSNWIPYVYSNDQGELEGYAYQMFDTLTNNLGIHYEMSFDPEYTWNELLDDMGRDGNPIQYDVAVADSVTAYDDDFARYSYPIRSEEVYVVGLANTEIIDDLFDLHDKKVGVIPYYAATTYLETNLVFKDFVVYQTLDDMIEGLKNGEIEYFAVIKSEFEGLHFVQKHYDIVPKFTIREDFDVAILFPNYGEDTDILVGLYNKALVLSDISDIGDELFNMQVDLNEVVQKRTVTIIILSVTSVILLVGLVSIYYVRNLRKTTLRDELTQLYNRRALFSKSNIAQFKYLYYFDFDNFKVINDSYGHKIGDNVLVHIAKKLKEEFDGNIYRLGGDEFIVLSNVKITIDDLRKDQFLFDNDGIDIRVTFSVGAINIDDYRNLDLDQIIRYADYAMYEAKEQGRDRIVYVSKEIISSYNKGLIIRKTRLNERD